MITGICVSVLPGNSGQPVPLSTGVVCFREYLAAPPKARLESSHWGSATFKVRNPAPGPADPWWESTQYRPPHPGDAAGFVKDWEKPQRLLPVDFVSTLDVFWVEHPRGTHVLMDHETRRLVRVSTLPEEIKGPFWGTCLRLMDEATRPPSMIFTEEKVKELEEADDWRHPASYRWAELEKTQVWLCLHPAPAGAPTWVWDGQEAVYIPKNPTGEVSQFLEDRLEIEAGYGRFL